jgi:hypothetical protein
MTEKTAYRQKLEAQLDEWGVEIDKLQAKASEASADAQSELEKQVHDLRDQEADAREKLDELSEAGEDAWQDVRGGVEQAWNSLGDAIQRAADRFG